MTMIQIGKLESLAEVRGILQLQHTNLAESLTAEESDKEGFVTLKHTEDLLWRMNLRGNHIIIKGEDQILGYALCMHPDFMPEIDHLSMVFDLFPHLSWKGKMLSEHSFLIMGQICIDKKLRAQGYFQKLYQNFVAEYAPIYDWCVTIISPKNVRSMKAHRNLGFETIYSMQEEGKEVWELVALDMKKYAGGFAT